MSSSKPEEICFTSDRMKKSARYLADTFGYAVRYDTYQEHYTDIVIIFPIDTPGEDIDAFEDLVVEYAYDKFPHQVIFS